MLTDAAARNAKPRDKAYKLPDSGGLYLYVSATGARSWRLKYRFSGKEQLLTIGSYPDLSLQAARQARDDAKRMLREGLNPSFEKKRKQAERSEKAKYTFEAVAREWHELNKDRWAPVHAADVLRSFERDIFPLVGGYPVGEMTPAVVLESLRSIEARGAIETAKRIRQRMSAVFVYGISCGICDQDPAAVVTRALKPIPRKGRQPAIVDLEALRIMMKRVDETEATPVVRLAHRLLALTATRVGSLRRATWDQFEGLDGDSPVWRIPPENMNGTVERKAAEDHEHVAPLVPAAAELLRVMQRLTGRGLFVFPSQRSSHRPMSENAIGYMLNRCGYHGRHTPHGWRAAFSTIMNERAVHQGRHSDRAVIDAMLAHKPMNKIEAAYNRAEHMGRRRELAQEWADLILTSSVPAANLIGTRCK